MNEISEIRRIGVLTSGGDCAGLNAAIRAVVYRASFGYGWDVVGIENGTLGLLSRPIAARPLGPSDFDGRLIRESGTFLGSTNKGNPFAFEMPDGSVRDRSGDVAAAVAELGLDAVVGIGGDGILALLKRHADQGGFPLVCIPKTIDNDVGVTEVSIGYDTAVHVATEALDRLQPTAASHGRVMILEVMGRDAGHIALVSGIAGGADVILIPEIGYDIDVVAAKLSEAQDKDRKHALMVVAEGCPAPDGNGKYGGVGHAVAEALSGKLESEIRVTVLGHVQRGGVPTARDRLMAAAFGTRAVDLLAEGQRDRMVAWRDRQVIDVPIADAIANYRGDDVDGAVVATARGLGISLGDA
ncbi:MAG: 6-phosphofructokinase [Rhodospirillaceae bacterium]|nr:6-phosphofructokinase [Rhodospirillaceae bacterium]